MKYTYCKKDFALAKRYVDAVLTMNELYAGTLTPTEDPIESEVFTPPPVAAVAFDRIGPWTEVKALLLDLLDQYKAIGNQIRACYMTEQILSVVALGEWSLEQQPLPYLERVARLMRIDPTPVTDVELQAGKSQLSGLLSDRGYRGPLEQQFRCWRENNLIPDNSLQQVMDGLIADTKEQTIDLGITEIAEIEVGGVVMKDVSYQGYCDFDNRKIYINGDLGYTYQNLQHLVCHETFPGHMAHMQLRKALVEQERIPADAALVVVCTASSPIFEGLADNGAEFIGRNSTVDARINLLYEELKEKAGLTASWMLGGAGKSRDEVAAYLREAVFADDTWINARLRLISYPLRTPFLPSYWRGNQAVREAYRPVDKHRSAQFIRYLYENMHSVNTLRKFV